MGQLPRYLKSSAVKQNLNLSKVKIIQNMFSYHSEIYEKSKINLKKKSIWKISHILTRSSGNHKEIG